MGQLREAMRIKHSSLKTEKSYVHWVRQFLGENFYILVENSLFTDISREGQAGNPLENVLFPSEKAKRRSLQRPGTGAVLYQIILSSPPPQKTRKGFAGKEVYLWINANYGFLFLKQNRRALFPISSVIINV